MERLTTRYSTILIAVGDETHVYRSMDEVPEELRDQLIDSTTGENSATLLIADPNGRQEILRLIAQKQEDLKYAALAAGLMKGAGWNAERWRRWSSLFALAGRALLIGSLGYVIWLLASFR